uniref:Uncharacterized protein n=1 Tax=viral metagenome TaxID=1070528 RepID=A0A6C0JHT2_9ZZZZ
MAEKRKPEILELPLTVFFHNQGPTSRPKLGLQPLHTPFESPQLYNSFFTTDYQDAFRTQLIQIMPTHKEYVHRLALSKKSYFEQSTELDEDKKREFKQLYFRYSLLIDYIDMVHDITKCFDYILFLLKKLKLNENLNQLQRLITDLCGGNYSSIRIKTSHEIQKFLINQYIDELRKMGFLISYYQDPISVTKENASQTVSDITVCARESGRYFQSFLESTGVERVLTSVKHNALGAIDGCKGDKECTSETVTWRHTVAGIFDLKITSTSGKSTIKVSIIGAKPSEEYSFDITGEIILDDVIQLLQNEKIPFRRTGGQRTNNIKPNFQFDKNDPTHCAVLISLKTICDKRLLQRMQTDYSGTGMPSIRLDAFTTTDRYVAAGTVLAFLGGDIQYCPSVLLTREDGFDRYDFEKFDDIGEELLKRYCYFSEYLKFFSLQSPGYDAGHKPDSLIVEAFDFTTRYIRGVEEKVSNQEHLFYNFWEFIFLTAVSKSEEKWEIKKRDCSDKVSKVQQCLETDLSLETNKQQLINSLLSIPTVIPSISELIAEIEEQQDDIDVLDKRIPFGILYNLFINRPKANAETDQFLWNKAFPTSDLWDKVSIDTINNFIKEHKLKHSNASLNFLPKSYIVKASGTNIIIVDNFLLIQYLTEELGELQHFVSNYKLNEDDDELMITIINNSAGRGEFRYLLRIPITAELLINISFKLETGRRQTIDDLYPLYDIIGKKLFSIVKEWLQLQDLDEVAFKNFLINCILSPDSRDFNRIWIQSQPGYQDLNNGFQLTGPSGKAKGGKKTTKRQNKKNKKTKKLRKHKKGKSRKY